MNNNSNNYGDCGTTCSECGRPWAICKQDGGCGCNKCKDIKFCEYGRMANGCIREKQPGCPMQAVIPSVTVESIEGIKNLADCLVHVSDINTTFYIDDKHRPIITWAGPIDIPGYDMEGNPNNYRDQIVTDVANQIAVIYDKSGNGYTFGLAENLDVQDEINNKLDQMAESGVLGQIVADYSATKLDYFRITSGSTSADIISAFASEKAKVIEFEEGEYTLENKLILTSNTKVMLNGATIKASATGVNIFGYALDSEWTGYDGIHDVEFIGGKIGTSTALMHNARIKFEGIEFLATATTHIAQIASCKDIVFKDCIFDGIVINDSIASQLETIQIETATRASQPYLNNDSSASYDNGGNEDITIEGCTFKAGDGANSRLYCAIGHHSTDDITPYFAKRTTIKNCMFESAYYSQICPTGFADSKIEGCTFNQTNEVNEVYNIRFRYNNKNIIIENNTFNGGAINITNVNIVYSNEGLLIRNNYFSTEFNVNYSNIHIKNWTKVKIIDNTFDKAKQRNIYLSALDNNNEHASDILIENNKFTCSNIITEGGQNIFLSYCSKVNIKNNIFNCDNDTVHAIYGNPGRVSDIVIGYNEVVSSLTTINFIGGLTDYTNISNKLRIIYGGSATYATLTSQPVTSAVTQFNTLYLLLQKNNDAGYIYNIKIKPFYMDQKINLNVARSYPISEVDANGDAVTALFKINTDGTIDYSSPSGLTLRKIYGLNEVMY